jgi:hypothetical protein
MPNPWRPRQQPPSDLPSRIIARIRVFHEMPELFPQLRSEAGRNAYEKQVRVLIVLNHDLGFVLADLRVEAFGDVVSRFFK